MPVMMLPTFLFEVRSALRMGSLQQRFHSFIRCYKMDVPNLVVGHAHCGMGDSMYCISGYPVL